MRLPLFLSGQRHWLPQTVTFFRKHFAVIMGLGLVAALGRVMQLGGFGSISSTMHWVLEVVIESARLLIFLYVLGLASIKNGYLRIGRLLSRKGERKQAMRAAGQKLKGQWLPVLLNMAGFLVIAAGINFAIDHIAYETCLYLNLKKEGILAAGSSEWTILLFFKNISVIPFTLAFEALFLLWLTNRLHGQVKTGLVE